MTGSPKDLASLRSLVSGVVLAADEPGFAEEVAAWNTAESPSPDLVVGAANAVDVSAAVSYAASAGLPVRVQATGHGAVGGSGGMLITTKRIDTLAIDADERVATIGAGVQWGAVVAAAADAGLAPIPGSSPTVGAVGYLLGGGLGPLARSHGFSSDYVLGFTVVTADGEIIEVSANEHPNLFWALRGGKGGLGVVVDARVRLVELPELYAGSLVFDAPQIEPALRAWVDNTASADDRVTTSAMILRVPDLPFIPEPIRGRTLLMLRFAFPGAAEEGERLAAPLRAAAEIYLDQLGVLPASAMASIHNDPTEPGPGWGRGRLLLPLDQDFATALLGQLGAGVQTPLIGVEVRHLGSAVSRDVPGGTATGGRGEAFALQAIGAPNPSLFETVLPGATAALFSAIAPWISPRTTINWAGHPDTQQEYVNAWPPETFERLKTVRATYDPSGMFAYGWN